jgi:hypothetical protein
MPIRRTTLIGELSLVNMPLFIKLACGIGVSGFGWEIEDAN